MFFFTCKEKIKLCFPGGSVKYGQEKKNFSTLPLRHNRRLVCRGEWCIKMGKYFFLSLCLINWILYKMYFLFPWLFLLRIDLCFSRAVTIVMVRCRNIHGGNQVKMCFNLGNYIHFLLNKRKNHQNISCCLLKQKSFLFTFNSI